MPVFRTSHQLRAQGIALHIARDRQEMLIGLDGKGFEAALIDRAGSRRVIVGVPALCMGDGDSADDFGEFSVMSRPEEEVPVIRHQAIGGDADPGLGLGFSENRFKGGVISGCLKQREPAHTTVQDVVGEVSGRVVVKKRLPNRFLVFW